MLNLILPISATFWIPLHGQISTGIKNAIIRLEKIKWTRRRVVTVPNLVLHRSVSADTSTITGMLDIPLIELIFVYSEIGTNITYSILGSCLFCGKTSIRNRIKIHLNYFFDPFNIKYRSKLFQVGLNQTLTSYFLLFISSSF